MSATNNSSQTTKIVKKIVTISLVFVSVLAIYNFAAVVNKLSVMFVAGDIGPIVIMLAVAAVFYATFHLARDVRSHARLHATDVNRSFNASKERRMQAKLDTAAAPVEVETIAGNAEVA